MTSSEYGDPPTAIGILEEVYLFQAELGVDEAESYDHPHTRAERMLIAALQAELDVLIARLEKLVDDSGDNTGAIRRRLNARHLAEIPADT